MTHDDLKKDIADLEGMVEALFREIITANMTERPDLMAGAASHMAHGFRELRRSLGPDDAG